jgi:hypothetical protein
VPASIAAECFQAHHQCVQRGPLIIFCCPFIKKRPRGVTGKIIYEDGKTDFAPHFIDLPKTAEHGK